MNLHVVVRLVPGGVTLCAASNTDNRPAIFTEASHAELRRADLAQQVEGGEFRVLDCVPL